MFTCAKQILSFLFYFVFILLCGVVKNSVHTTAERVLQLAIVSSSPLRLELETRSRAGKTSFSALGAKYTIVLLKNIICKNM
jgi:hypothetical protein